MADEFHVEAIFRIRSRGWVLVGTVVGIFRGGDRLLLRRPGGTTASGRLIAVEFHNPPDGRDDQHAILVDEDFGAVVAVGDVLTKQDAD